MRVLLDTNAFIWLTDDEKKANLGKESRRMIANSAVVYVSSLSVAELYIKSMIGKLKMVPNLVELTTQAGLFLLDFKASHAEAIQNLPSLVRHDPFDRMLLAQAQSEGLLLLTSDTTLLGLKLDYVFNVHK